MAKTTQIKTHRAKPKKKLGRHKKHANKHESKKQYNRQGL